MSTYAGVVKEIPILPFPVGSGSFLVKRGTVLEWDPALQIAILWTSGSAPVFGVATSDADLDLNTVDVYVGKGSSVQLLCDVGVIPDMGNLLYYSAPGAVGLTGTAGQQVAKAVGVGMNGMVEAVLL